MAMEQPDRIPRRSHAKSSSGHGRSSTARSNSSSTCTSKSKRSERTSSGTTCASTSEAREKNSRGRSSLDLQPMADHDDSKSKNNSKSKSQSEHRARPSHSVDSQHRRHVEREPCRKSSDVTKSRKSSITHHATSKDRKASSGTSSSNNNNKSTRGSRALDQHFTTDTRPAGKSKHVRSNSCDSRRQPEPPARYVSREVVADNKASSSSKGTRGAPSSLESRLGKGTTRQGRTVLKTGPKTRSHSCDSRMSTDKEQPWTKISPSESSPPLQRSNSGPTQNYNKKPQPVEPTKREREQPSEDAATHRSKVSRQREEELCYHDSARSSLPETQLPSLLDDLLVRRGRRTARATTTVRSNSLDSRRDDPLFLMDSPSPEQTLFWYQPPQEHEQAVRNNKSLRSKSFDEDPAAAPRRSGGKKTDVPIRNPTKSTTHNNRDRRTSLGYRDTTNSPSHARSVRTSQRSSVSNNKDAEEGEAIPTASLRGRRSLSHKRASMGTTHNYRSSDKGEEIPAGSLRGRRAVARKGAVGKPTTPTTSAARDARKSMRQSRSFDPKKSLEGAQESSSKKYLDMACEDQGDDPKAQLQRNRSGPANYNNRSNGNLPAPRRQLGRRQTVTLVDSHTQANVEQQLQQQQQREKKVAEIAKAFKLSSHACSQLASKASSTGAKLGQLPSLTMQVKFPADLAPPNNTLTRSSSHKSRSKIADKGIQSLVQQLDDPPSLGAALLFHKPNSIIRRSRSSLSSHSTATTLNMSHSTMHSLHSLHSMHSMRSTSTTSSTSTGNSFASESSNTSEARKSLMAKAQRVKALRGSFRNNTTAQEKSQRQKRSSSEHNNLSLMESL